MSLDAKNTLLQRYPYKIEMHTHSSPGSSCSEVKAEDVVRFYKEHGYDAIVMTNHFIHNADKEAVIHRQLSDFRQACQAGEKIGLKVLLGTEARFDENPNDYLIYGVNADILGQIYDYFECGLEAFRKNVPLNNSVFVQAHPYRNPSVPVDPSLLDGVEVYNLHPSHNSKVAMAALYASENPSLLVTAGTDFHHDVRGHCGICALRTPVLPEDSFQLAEILKAKDYVIQIYDAILIP